MSTQRKIAMAGALGVATVLVVAVVWPRVIVSAFFM